jgi:sialidase-1
MTTPVNALFMTNVFGGGQQDYHTYRIPALVTARDGRLLAFCEGRRNSASDSGDIGLLLKTSDDSGTSWSAQTVVHEEQGSEPVTIGNPCPIVDRRDGIIHLVFSRNNRRIFITQSADGGGHWSTPRELSGLLKDFDYPVVRVGTGPGHGLQLKDGSLIVPIWLCDGETTSKDRTYRSGVIRSDDRGVTWTACGLVPPGLPDLNECVALERRNGSLLLNMRAKGGCRVLSESADGGRTWSSPVRDPDLVCPTCQASLLACPGGTVFSNPASNRRQQLTVRWSEDEGRTWPQSRLLHAGCSGYSDLASLDDNTVGCLFECGEYVYHERIDFARFGVSWIRK